MSDNVDLNKEQVANVLPLKQSDAAAAGVLQDKDRLTITLQMVHHHCCVDPFSARSNFDDFLETTEQPYNRRVRVGREWKKIDYGWLADPGLHGMVLIENLSGRKGQKDEGQILEISIQSLDKPIMIVQPRRFQLFEPTSGTIYVARSAGEPFEYELSVIAR